MGKTTMRAAKSEKATKTAKTAKKPVRRSSPAMDILELGIKHLYDKEYKSARSCFQKIIDHHSEEKDVVVTAENYLKVCETHMASQKFSPATAEDYYNLGIVKLNENQYDDAIKSLSEAAKLNAKGDHIYYALAAAYALKNDPASAVKNLERAIKLNPENGVFAKSDPDFTNIRKEKSFLELLGIEGEAE
jgi:tetratricopeptide (TPR) repeat protein